MVAEVYCKNDPQKFRLMVKLIGDFIREDDSPQDAVHKATYKILFPHAKALITSISVTANVPPVFFPDINIDEQSVYMIENPKK
jgi:preprotein translocase subunit SecB